MFPRYFKIKPDICEKRDVEPDVPVSKHECSSSESDDLEDIYKETPSFENYDYPYDYWTFQKAVKYLSYGRPVITSLSLITCINCDFQDPIMLQSLKDNRVLEILLNILHSNDKRVQIISLRFLRKLSAIRILRQKIVYLRGVESMVTLLGEPQMDMKQEAAETITSIADFHKAWKAVRLSRGIPLLVNLLYLPKTLLQEDNENLSDQLVAAIKAAEAAAETLFTVCRCRKNQTEFLLSGGLLGCQKILKTSHVQLAAITLQLVQLCASQKMLRVAVRNLGMLEDFHRHFYGENQKILEGAAQAAYICAEEESKEFFGKPGFVDKLYEIIQRPVFHSDEKFMIAISGALWKSAENEINARRLQSLNAVPFLIQLLSTQTACVQEHIVACLTCCITNPQMRTTFRKNNGVEALIGLLHTIHSPLIMHLNKALALASLDNECLTLMEKYNALRRIWSHLKNDDASVVSNTAWQLAAILKNIEKSSTYIRSLIGGVQLLTDLLRSKHTRVLTPVCALIVILSKDKENLRILTDYQVVERLSKLVKTKCRSLRYHLCMAITACCQYKNNREEFAAKPKAVSYLIRILKSKAAPVVGAAVHALGQLSWIPYWCAVMYNSPGVYEILIEQMKHKDRGVQECAADIIQKMRLFALNRDDNIPDWLISKHEQFFTH